MTIMCNVLMHKKGTLLFFYTWLFIFGCNLLNLLSIIFYQYNILYSVNRHLAEVKDK